MKLTYKNVLEELKTSIPELYKHPDYDEIAPDYSGNLPYVVFSYLQMFYKESFNNRDIETVKKIADFLERVSSVKDNDLKSLLMFGFMEVFYGNYDDFDKDMLDYFGENTKQVLIDTVEHNSKIGMEDKDKAYQLFGDKLKK
ncbi:MAG: hypothetical protein COV55_05075 [Candidatus Komeilibacteria bacterium CG11_big_fil_rev_8_21_14_0_20_36_20]|uniref:DUF7674 domain-containing protein n=1 Tax=Candidatus Komeilibacteria bacterium CG11_big_fil_rev_8_21_14_0_20_36_20 TaxID=1974477 RepID=A0A2H0NAZ9_9BACT|nr:MAG: hypothetical protein COV55_05075 [Candidatus Komeilibacteria bacterium CG11_big_fil_rev_8_21_14_0_20_36_20]PIR82073.1 MAG: hypothetical protein COU21_00310 [Candidatus Komeilibacteria bacterium CG10_big_fil_rev_8_21_14_0_10_36_65]PJC55052.1 MAG: hypothetical protein CO027_04295 [Candidatus Komeilibacteria bacterium CG_4_9_14_0_2_um_filter_36_13]